MSFVSFAHVHLLQLLSISDDEQIEGKPCKSQINDRSKLISDVSVNQNSSKKHQVL